VGLGRGLLAAGLAVGGAALGARGLLRRGGSRPGLVRIAALDDEVEVLRDRWGVPHLYARTEHDLFFANGVVHAEERLWQMELNRRAAAGRLSELFGARTLDVDRMLRRFGFARAARAEVGLLADGSRAALEAYAAGVNWASEARARPLEMLLLRHRPEPWTIVDSLSWAKLMGWSLSVNWDTEVARARLLERLGPEVASELEPLYPAGGWVTAHGEEIAAAAGSLLDSYRLLQDVTGLGSLGGSNAWAVGPSRSASGAALLANDMHLAPGLPSVWYELSLDAGSLHCVGCSLPGIPGIVVGHNGRIAWGFTASLADVQDLFVEEVHPDDPRRFRRGDDWEQARVVVEEIRVRGQPRWQSQEVLLSSNGVVVTELLPGGRATVSLRASPLEPGRTFDAGMELMRARDWAEFRAAMRGWSTPSLGVAYADADGNVGYQLVGSLPVRGQGDGSVPVPGADPAYAWRGWVPFEELPSRLNPPEGYVATANNKPHGGDRPHAFGTDWADAYRVGRIVELLRERDKHDRASFRAIQLDTTSLAARGFVAEVGRILADEQPIDPLEREALRILLLWDGALAPESAAAAIYELFRIKLLRFLYAPQLGDLVDVYLGAPPGGRAGGSSYSWRHSSRLLAAMRDPEWPEKRGHRSLSWRDVLLICLGDAVTQLRIEHGEEIGCWEWGRLHQLTFAHTLAENAVLRRLLNRGPYPVGGDVDTPMQIGAPGYRPDGAVTWVPSYRQIVDFADVRLSQSMHTTGQSGHPGSRHYDDLIPMWLAGEYHPMLWTRADVEANVESETRLLPTDELWPRP
jgi:penicillin amidase